MKELSSPETDTRSERSDKNSRSVKQADKKYIPLELEAKIQKMWDEGGIYFKVKKHRENGKRWNFCDGPPYTTGSIHIGTAWNKIIKDTVIRYRRMLGHNVRDQPGYDMHGLPIEVKVEQKLGIQNKKEIESMGIARFIHECREYALNNLRVMTSQFKEMGVWMDWDNPYMTIKNDYIESAWWTCKCAYEKGLLEKKERVLTWCPRCQTALAEAEIEYTDREDPSIYVRFPVKDTPNEYLAIWTTTPWTLPANKAVSVHPDYVYARVRIGSDSYWVVKEKAAELAALLGAGGYQILEERPGTALEGREYVHPFLEEIEYQREILRKEEWAHKVILGTHVTADNTGLVHTAPGHGPEDFEVGALYGLTPFSPIDEASVYTEAGGPYKGLYTKDADPLLIETLKKKGYLMRAGTLVHRYGHCWRCKSPITYRTTSQWFIKVSQIVDKLISEVESVRWTPEWVGSGRMKDWVKNARDWCISRQRYWGIPIPVWVCSCGKMIVIGNASEFRQYRAKNYKEGMDLHRPSIDEVLIPCSCGKDMKRVPDIFDVWYDSACASWAQVSYPSHEEVFRKWGLAQWIVEGYEQTRGWYYSQLCAGVISFGTIPYKECLSHGLVLDNQGRKMSKSLGNVVAPKEVMGKFGVDSFRFYILSASPLWDDLIFSWENLQNTDRMFGILWNVYYFSTLYMSLDKFRADKPLSYYNEWFRDEDRWLLSRIQTLKKTVTAFFQTYELEKACRAIEDFILNDLSRLYVKLIRDRVWLEGEDKSKECAYRTLAEALIVLSKIMAPVTPYIAEEIYRNLCGKYETVHMEDWPAIDKEYMVEMLEKQMTYVSEIVESAQNARQKAKLKLRWPCRKLIIKADTDEITDAAYSLTELIKFQTKSKEVEVISPKDELPGMWMKSVPVKKEIGPAFKKEGARVSAFLEKLGDAEARHLAEQLEKTGFALVPITDEKGSFEARLTPAMVQFVKEIPINLYEAKFTGGTIYIDTTVTDEIKAEGMASEVKRRIQEMRKEMDLPVEAMIEVSVRCSGETEKLLKNVKPDGQDMIEYIAKETRAAKLVLGADAHIPPVTQATDGYIKEWDVEEEKLLINIVRVK
ncbi:MAG: isoleucine--tRNA ligase [Thermoplasmata archaeon]